MFTVAHSAYFMTLRNGVAATCQRSAGRWPMSRREVALNEFLDLIWQSSHDNVRLTVLAHPVKLKGKAHPFNFLGRKHGKLV